MSMSVSIDEIDSTQERRMVASPGRWPWREGSGCRCRCIAEGYLLDAGAIPIGGVDVSDSGSDDH